MIDKLKTPFNNFMDAMVDELIAMTDEEVLDGADSEAEKAAGLELLAAAKMRAGQRRLAAAKVGAASFKKQYDSADQPEVSMDEVRRYITQESNDSRYTLAARSLSQISDEEALRIYRQLKAVESDGGVSGDAE